MKQLLNKDNGQSQDNGYRQVVPYLGLGLNLAVTVILFVYLGKWLDQYFQRKNPLFLLIFSILGLFAGLYHFISSVIKLEKKKDG